jgi:murein DD-endopeptidase MepM/ murein hydrolase activator NlpD
MNRVGKSVIFLAVCGLLAEFPSKGQAAFSSIEAHRIEAHRIEVQKKERRKQGVTKLEEGLFVGFLWPLYGETSSSYGSRVDPIDGGITRHHAGVDLAAPKGTGVAASRAGRVVFAGFREKYGNLVILRHSNDMETRYGHLSSIKVKKGAFVRPGQALGKVGSTGRSTGNHLHFEIRVSGQAVDPLKWLVPYGFMMPRREPRK